MSMALFHEVQRPPSAMWIWLFSWPEPLQSYEQLKLELAVQAEIETACGLDAVDVRAINDAPLMVQGRIVQQGKLVYERDRRHRVDFEVMTRQRHFDFAPVARRPRDAFLERVRRDGMLHG